MLELTEGFGDSLILHGTLVIAGPDRVEFYSLKARTE
jgi:hypothetical protein